MDDIKKGQIVFSKAGRDKNNFFIVVDYKAPFVYLVDGTTRRLENPKKKKDKHIKVTSHIDYALQDAIERQSYMTNADIRKSLSQFIKDQDHEQ